MSTSCSLFRPVAARQRPDNLYARFVSRPARFNGPTPVALNLTDSTGNMVWQISMGVNPADANLRSAQNSTLNVVLNKPDFSKL